MPKPIIAYLLLITTTLLWGGNAVAGQLAIDQISPFLLVTLRWLLVVPLAFIVAWQDLKTEWQEISKRKTYTILMAVCGFTAFNSLFYLASYTTSAINIGIVQGAIPIMVLIMGMVLYQYKLKLYALIGILVTMLGVIIVASSGSFHNLVNLIFAKGDILMLIACLFYAFYTNGLRKRPKGKGMAFFAIMACAAMISSIPLSLYEWQAGTIIWPQGASWWLVIYIGLFPSFLAQFCFLKGVDALGPARAGIFVNLVPIFAPLLAVLILDEPFHSYHAIALFLVLLGIFLAEHKHFINSKQAS